ncbi:hypothetical protein HCU01_31120 [Halomonas cupida]|uniref:L,D-transpeptidase catalytic domain n=1 Tax=Halomonas cupida TaxID=44933 RepID=A0A1M7L872_9GAMM|nr:L,D-transpeptidase [Halomonas cupida]GEN25163.1 hypothetical protein HCU01_31120 [Halomonas cupida]SHM74199.1 L,D-transpeptidase catalytic domain [Halomonas cupida]
MGPRVLYLGQTLYRIHGSNEPEAVGDAVSSGCFRMTNADVIDLYNRARIGCGFESSGKVLAKKRALPKTCRHGFVIGSA